MFKNIYKDKKVIITGNTGFKGSWLSIWLLKLGAKVYGLSKDIPTEPSMYNELGLKKSKKEELVGGDSKKNAEIINEILKGNLLGAKKNIVLLNSAAALYINGKTENIKSGLDIVNETIESGKALKKLEDLIELTNS